MEGNLNKRVLPTRVVLARFLGKLVKDMKLIESCVEEHQAWRWPLEKYSDDENPVLFRVSE